MKHATCTDPQGLPLCETCVHNPEFQQHSADHIKPDVHDDQCRTHQEDVCATKK